MTRTVGERAGQRTVQQAGGAEEEEEEEAVGIMTMDLERSVWTEMPKVFGTNAKVLIFVHKTVVKAKRLISK